MIQVVLINLGGYAIVQSCNIFCFCVFFLNLLMLVSLLLTLNRLQTLFWCFHCWLWMSKCRQGKDWKKSPGKTQTFLKEKSGKKYLFESMTWRRIVEVFFQSFAMNPVMGYHRGKNLLVPTKCVFQISNLTGLRIGYFDIPIWFTVISHVIF